MLDWDREGWGWMTNSLHCLRCEASAVLVLSIVRTRVSYLYGPPDLVGRTVPAVFVQYHCTVCHRGGRVRFEPKWSPDGCSGSTQCSCGMRARLGRIEPD